MIIVLFIGLSRKIVKLIYIANGINFELNDEVVIAKFATTTKHGAIDGKTQTRMIHYYSLDAIGSDCYIEL